MLSFEEATNALAAKRRISYEEASLLIAERYGQGGSAPITDDIAFDDPYTTIVPSTYQRTVSRGRVVRLEDDPSPRQAAARQVRVDADKAEGDRYRTLSRGTSFHNAS